MLNFSIYIVNSNLTAIYIYIIINIHMLIHLQNDNYFIHVIYFPPLRPAGRTWSNSEPNRLLILVCILCLALMVIAFLNQDNQLVDKSFLTRNGQTIITVADPYDPLSWWSASLNWCPVTPVPVAAYHAPLYFTAIRHVTIFSIPCPVR